MDCIIQTTINEHTSVFKFKAMHVSTTKLIRFVYKLIMNMFRNSKLYSNYKLISTIRVNINLFKLSIILKFFKIFLLLDPYINKIMT